MLFFNYLYILLELFPHKPWNFNVLAWNPNLTYYIQKNFTAYENHRNGEIYNGELPTIKEINPNDQLNNNIYKRLHLTQQIINQLSFKPQFMKNKTLTLDLIRNNPQFPWDWAVLSEHAAITPQFINANPDLPWDINKLSKNDSITWDFILEHINWKWNWWLISSKPSITVPILHTYKDKLSWNQVSKNKSITWDIVQQNPDLPWNYGELSYNINITETIISSNPEYKWSYFALENKASLDIIIRNIEVMSTWNTLQHLPYIHWSKLAPLPFTRKKSLYKNPTFTCWDIIKISETCDWDVLSHNEFNKHPYIRSQLIAKYYLHRWRIYTAQRRDNRIIFELTIHELKMRHRDNQNKVEIKHPLD